MTTIYLIRHSVRMPTKSIIEYHSEQDKLIKNEKIILNVEGEERAKILCQKELFDDIDVIYSSNCVRALQTAKYLMERLDLPVIIDDRFDERRTGIPNDHIYPDWFERQYLDANFKTEGGESQKDVQKRYNEVIHELLEKHKDQKVAVFCHGIAITFYLLLYCKLISIHDRELEYEYQGKTLFNKSLNAPEVFRLTFDNDSLQNIELLEFEDLPFNHGI